MDFDKICRLCCVEKSPMRHILENNDRGPLADVFSNVLQIAVYTDDHLPQQICEECTTTIVNLHQTIEHFRQNDLRLRQLLVQGYEVKEEPLPGLECLMEPETQLDQSVIAREDKPEDEIDKSIEPQDDGGGNKNECKKSFEKVKSVPESQPKKRRRSSKKNVDEFGNEIPQLPQKRIRKRNPNLPRANDYKCYVCKSDSLGSAEILLEHLNVSHADEVPHTCPLCVHETVTVKNVTSLNVHKRMHAMPVQCPHCDLRVISKSTLNTHIEMKHRQDPHPSRCEQCDKLFPSKMALKIHSHMHTLLYNCEFCGKRFHAPSKMNLHIKRKHGTIEKVKCHICQKELQSLDALQRHIETMHSNAQYACSHCPKTYTSELTLRLHEKKHANDPNYESRMNHNLKSYYTVVEIDNGPAKRKCNICNMVVSNIGAHLKYKHFPRAMFPCDQCEREFRDRKSLAVHKLEHDVGKFLKCPICDREFNERRNLLSHLKTKKHRDHPLAQNLDWLDAMYPMGRAPIDEGAENGILEDDLIEDEREGLMGGNK